MTNDVCCDFFFQIKFDKYIINFKSINEFEKKHFQIMLELHSEPMYK